MQVVKTNHPPANKHISKHTKKWIVESIVQLQNNLPITFWF